ncbi:hypothetical protein PPERSA_04246 [Pseudocohnilembus persalinus]|uniref:Uncharacterized protein n=1 Tax=Pseudocohnilembus persalinus TaxID=266149 RepID=A0A0V0QNP7_PSEPJ|nr:hypothetical protein PPERSA_04246 [Pseudocohnilembus persalinus]|eukprot:KRX03738.1 hypothetical protein PPERSA_04246 [Pseudocohnilembus persalinus]
MQGLSNEEMYEQYQKYLIQKLQMLQEQIKKIETFDQWRPQIFKKFQRIDLPETEAMVCDYEQNIYSLGQAEGSPGKRYLVSQSSFSFGVHKFIVEFLNVDELLRSCDCGIGIMTEQDYLNKIDVWLSGLVPFKCLFDNCAKNMVGVPNFSQHLNGEQNKIKVVLDMDNFKFTISTLDDSMISQNTSSYSLENKTFRFFINFYQTSANPQIKICNTF